MQFFMSSYPKMKWIALIWSCWSIRLIHQYSTHRRSSQIRTVFLYNFDCNFETEAVEDDDLCMRFSSENSCVISDYYIKGVFYISFKITLQKKVFHVRKYLLRSWSYEYELSLVRLYSKTLCSFCMNNSYFT